MARVHNKRDRTAPADAVYIGRGSKWGNPHILNVDGNRAEVIRKYEVYLRHRPDLIEAAKKELKGKDLVCCCKPKACHGDVLLSIANGGEA